MASGITHPIQGPLPLPCKHNPAAQGTAVNYFFLPWGHIQHLWDERDQAIAPHSSWLADPKALLSCAGPCLQAAHSPDSAGLCSRLTKATSQKICSSGISSTFGWSPAFFFQAHAALGINRQAQRQKALLTPRRWEATTACSWYDMNAARGRGQGLLFVSERNSYCHWQLPPGTHFCCDSSWKLTCCHLKALILAEFAPVSAYSCRPLQLSSLQAEVIVLCASATPWVFLCTFSAGHTASAGEAHHLHEDVPTSIILDLVLPRSQTLLVS